MILALLTSRLTGLIAAPLAVILALALGWQTVALIGVRGDLAKARDDLSDMTTSRDDWRRYGLAEKAAYDRSEALRAAEAAQAATALSEASKTCSARVARARASGAAISAIITPEPRRDPNACPDRALVDPRILRDALAPRTPAR